jgi:hypothetical protein
MYRAYSNLSPETADSLISLETCGELLNTHPVFRVSANDLKEVSIKIPWVILIRIKPRQRPKRNSHKVAQKRSVVAASKRA